MNYWSCSKFASWAWEKVGHPKPRSASMNQWKKWRRIARKRHCLTYLFVEELIDRVQWFVMLPVEVPHTILYKLKNFQQKASYISTPHSRLFGYSDLRYKIEAGLFFEFERFVDIECAWMNNMKPRSWKERFQRGFTEPKRLEGLSQDGIEYLEFQRDHCPEDSECRQVYEDFINTYKWIKLVYNVRCHECAYDFDKEFCKEIQKHLSVIVNNHLYLWT